MHIKVGNFRFGIFFILSVLTLLVVGCKPTRLLTDDQYLLKSNKLIVDTKDVDKKEMFSYYRQKPNRKTFMLLYVHLSAYNFSKLGNERKWKNWLGRVIGEEPVVFDTALLVRTNSQFIRFMQNHSYYNATVENEVHYKHKRAKVVYKIKAGPPLRIYDVDYVVKDSSIAPLVFSDTASSLLKPGDKFMDETLQKERKRIVDMMRDSGYFKFNMDYVKYQVDSSRYRASVVVEIPLALEAGEGSKVNRVPHKKYSINNVYILPDFDPQSTIRNKNNYFNSFDTIPHNGYYFIYPGKKNIKPKTIVKATQIKSHSNYNQSIINNTSKHISSLKLFRLNNTLFTEDPNNDTLLDCQIRLTPFTYQNYSLNLETTNTQGNIGFGGYVNYQHKNLLKGAEVFNVRVSGSVERQGTRNIFEVGAETTLETPSFILPFKLERFYRKYYPKTVFSLAYNIRKKPEQYTRNLISASMGYNWSASQKVRHYYYPIDLSSVTLPEIADWFRDTIKGTYLENNYQDYFIMGGRYVLTSINSDKNKFHNHSYFRWNVEVAGNLSYLIHSNTNFQKKNDEGYYTFLNTRYAQFFKTDIDYRYYNYISQRNTFVIRAFAGVGVPYGNAIAIPFIKQYSSGGAQGMRAWLVRDLGPGTFSDTSNIYPDQYGDIKLEMNLEYRYDITRTLKGAYFIDMGNIWAISLEDERKGGQFAFNSFYKQFAIGTGFGLRYDLGFTVIRLDAGLKVRDPGYKTLRTVDGNEMLVPDLGADSWILFHKKFELNNFVLNFGIGYPF